MDRGRDDDDVRPGLREERCRGPGTTGRRRPSGRGSTRAASVAQAAFLQVRDLADVRGAVTVDADDGDRSAARSPCGCARVVDRAHGHPHGLRGEPSRLVGTERPVHHDRGQPDVEPVALGHVDHLVPGERGTGTDVLGDAGEPRAQVRGVLDEQDRRRRALAALHEREPRRQAAVHGLLADEPVPEHGGDVRRRQPPEDAAVPGARPAVGAGALDAQRTVRGVQHAGPAQHVPTTVRQGLPPTAGGPRRAAAGRARRATRSRRRASRRRRPAACRR